MGWICRKNRIQQAMVDPDGKGEYKMEISVVVPTRNEADNIRPLLRGIANALTGISYEVVFVDDSTDGTPEIIRRAAAETPVSVRLEHRENGNGLSSAVIRGFELAKGRFLAVMDADLQHPPEMLRRMYAAMLSGADLCAPSRFIPGGDDGGLRGYRKFVSASARWMGKFFISRIRRMSDPTGGLFMVRRGLLDGAAFKPIGWKILIEVAAVCPCCKIIEIPYAFQSRNSGESKISLKITMEYVKQLFSLLRRKQKYSTVEVERWDEEQVEKSLKELEGNLHYA
jgi:dolichol-phosphate mannosyltransferase